MSDLTYDPVLGERVSHFIQEDDGRLITGMVLLVEYIDTDGVERTAIAAAPKQKSTTTAGLIALGSTLSHHELRQQIISSHTDREDH